MLLLSSLAKHALTNPSARIGGKVVGACGGLLGQLATSHKKPNPSARIGVKLLGLAGGCWGSWRLLTKKLNLSARIGVKLLGLAGGFVRAAGDFSKKVKPLATSHKKPYPSAKIGVKLLGLGGLCYGSWRLLTKSQARQPELG